LETHHESNWRFSNLHKATMTFTHSDRELRKNGRGIARQGRKASSTAFP
jgi:hypothetical protein